jgi:NAD(P)H-flavin reductase
MVENRLKPVPAEISNIENQGQIAKLFKIKLKNSSDRNKFNFKPGQFVKLSIPGFGEAPFSICSNPNNTERFEILVKKAGHFTNKLFSLKKSNSVGVRGPLGNGFDLKNLTAKNISLISGGCGLAPMRSLISYFKNNQQAFKKLNIFYGSKNPDSLYFKKEFKDWQKFANLNLIVEEAGDNWEYSKGYVSDLIKNFKFDLNEIIYICGPNPMLAPIVEILRRKGILSKNIYFSLERNMYCGIGTCQHCNFGTKYVCKDGPIFSLEEIFNEEPNFFRNV